MLAHTTVHLVSPEPPGPFAAIAEADIEINAVDHRFAAEGALTTARAGLHDLEAILTHEIGHALGLAHPCDDGRAPSGVVDHTGSPPSRCSAARS